MTAFMTTETRTGRKRCDGCGQLKPVNEVKRVGGDRLCKNCRDRGTRPRVPLDAPHPRIGDLTRCGTCEAEVRMSYYTARSERTGKVLCDDCSRVPLSESAHFEPPRFESRSVLAPPRTRDLGRVPDLGFDECVRCHDPLFATLLTARSARTGDPVCEPCAKSGRIELRRAERLPTLSESRRYVDGVMAHLARQTDEERAELDELAQRMLRVATSTTDAVDDLEVRGGYEDFEENVDDDEAREAYWYNIDPEYRDLCDRSDMIFSSATYGPELDGVPVPGRFYEYRWWAAPDSGCGTEYRSDYIPAGEWR